MRSGLGRNIFAQGYSQIVTLSIQLGTIPFLLLSWGVERYGVWLLLTAIPAYLVLADFGFTFVAKNDMVMRVASGDRVGALATYQSVFSLLLLLCSVILLLLGLLVFVLPLDLWLNLGQETIGEVRWVLVIQFSSVLLYQFFLLICSGIRCEGYFATESILVATGRLTEAISIVLIALIGGGIFEASMGGLVTRLFFIFGTAIWVSKNISWLQLGFNNVQILRVKSLVKPSLTYMLVPISNAFMIQAPLVILGALSSPVAVALYSITRTVARLGMSGANMLSYAFTPAYSQAWGHGNRPKFVSLLNTHKFLLILGLVSYFIFAFLYSPFFILLISKHHISPNLTLCAIMTLSVASEMLWTSLFTPIVALNQHNRLPYLILLTSIASIVMSVFFPDPIGLATLVLLSHIVILLLVSAIFKWSFSKFLIIKDSLL